MYVYPFFCCGGARQESQPKCDAPKEQLNCYKVFITNVRELRLIREGFAGCTFGMLCCVPIYMERLVGARCTGHRAPTGTDVVCVRDKNSHSTRGDLSQSDDGEGADWSKSNTAVSASAGGVSQQAPQSQQQ